MTRGCSFHVREWDDGRRLLQRLADGLGADAVEAIVAEDTRTKLREPSSARW